MPEHGIDFAAFGAKAIALEDRCRSPAGAEFLRTIVHGTFQHAGDYSATAGRRPASQFSRSCRARVQSARFLVATLALPRNRHPSARAAGARASGGNNPKLIFIGWNERGPLSMVSMCPPLIWPRSAPWAVVGGGPTISLPRRSAAAKWPASRPTAADST